ncbi:elongation factor 3 [Aliidongia dinghuensis]|uniref:ATP-binding protein Uup n=1 Tax=Aliidongia dinghuensis TaxID=1867774 RepID=A0A8J2YSZ6_9PROT|nr:ATP-binding cassette domain-containing protein [Aliidongia dinghuensis]GGF17534.1 elongation factor 3 [Aliidongia dinghuensis]
MAVAPPLLALQNATLTFGGRPTFQEASVAVARGERICLVGRNGSGKSTLLKCLAGLIELDAGERFIQPGAHVAYMPQEPVFEPTMTIAEHVAEGLPGHEQDGATRYKVEAILAEVGLDPDRKLVDLSGGEGRRVSLARVFVAEPDVVLLDEPTNHLDIPAIEWLEARLVDYRGAILMISHDRAFLNRLSRRVLWLDRGRLRSLDKGFAAFDEWSEGVLAAEAAEEVRLDKKLASETIWLRQGISARRTRNMGRLRALMDLRQEKAERVGIRQAKIGTAAVTESGGQLVVEAKHIAKSFEQVPPDGGSETKLIAKDFSTKVVRGDRIGIIGANGAGKSTLLKILTGDLAPDAGKIRFGVNLVPAYFDQHRSRLDGEASVRDNLTEGRGDQVFVRGQPRHVNSYMRDFLFEDRQALTPAKALSGGERNRLLLAKVLAQTSNLLVLDEPTNDLDMDTLDLLEEVLADYDGTLFLVSHDRDFLDRLVTSVIAVEGDGEVEEYVGGYSDYLRQRPTKTEPAKAEQAKAAPKATPAPAKAEKPKAARLGFKEQHDLQRLPGVIEALGQEQTALQKALADPQLYARDRAAFERATARLDALQAELAEAEDRWLELEMKKAELG